ncbi:oxidoreductase [Streptomyces sp. PRh5]|uniref:aldo/keto reductase n=1 Tax=Streptomyces sp. PRh5 TaxID=1158056 RepID=UPI000447532A|nr:aldo/keto reductase [Streptomyces sp. PRh5]EXU64369.1 oxidoreductase [Streptomyces sp. PRh5]
MHYTTLGRRTGLRVSQYALGTANFGTAPGISAGREQSAAIFEAFAEAGGTFIDSADHYQGGEAESLLGELLAADRDHFVLATKYTCGAAEGRHINATGNSRKTMVRSLEASLKRLRTDYIDVYWAHLPDAITPVDEIVAAFDDLVRAGKILHGGLSNFPAWRIATAAAVAEMHHRAPIIGFQNEYSLAERTAERELLPMAEAFGFGAVLYSPLAGGLLTGKYRHGGQGRLSTRGGGVTAEDSAHKTAILDTVLAVAEEVQASAAQVSVAWLRARAARSATALIPVIGPRTMAQMDDYLAALDLDLTYDQYERLEKVSAVPLGSPHETADRALTAGLAGDAERIDRHPIPVI